MATVTKTPTSIVEGNIYFAGACHWSDITDMDTCGAGAANVLGACGGWMYSPVCTDFDFALAPTDVITKIEVKITGTQDGTSYLDYCSLMWNGAPVFMHCFQVDAVNPLDATSHTLIFQPTSGGDPNMWGVSWTPAMVNDVSFGCAFDGMHISGDAVNIDCVQITITYTPDGTPVVNTCDGIPCGETMSMEDAIKSLIAKFTLGGPRGFECIGLKMAARYAKCADLTDLTECGTKYTLEQALKAALMGDGCDGWTLRTWILPPYTG